MLSVFICEDDNHYRQLISKCIQDYINTEEFDIEVVLCTSDPTKILQVIETHKVNGLYFFDVELEGGYNGVNIAKDIRQYDPRGFIVFVTAHPKYMPITFEYKVEALAYIQKSEEHLVRQSICNCISDAYNRHVSRSDDGCYIFKSQSGRKVSCNHNEILFFETDSQGSKRIILHTKKRQYVFYGSIDEAEKMLPSGQFFRCHKSFIVNVGNLTRANKIELNQKSDRITMPDGFACSVSSRKKGNLTKFLETKFPG